MDKMMQLSKAALISKYEEMEKKADDYRDRLSRVTTLETKLVEKKAEVKCANAVIEKIHQSLQTVARMKYPVINRAYIHPQHRLGKCETDIEEPVVPEESHLINYLIELCHLDRGCEAKKNTRYHL